MPRDAHPLVPNRWRSQTGGRFQVRLAMTTAPHAAPMRAHHEYPLLKSSLACAGACRQPNCTDSQLANSSSAPSSSFDPSHSRAYCVPSGSKPTGATRLPRITSSTASTKGLSATPNPAEAASTRRMRFEPLCPGIRTGLRSQGQVGTAFESVPPFRLITGPTLSATSVWTFQVSGTTKSSRLIARSA